MCLDARGLPMALQLTLNKPASNRDTGMTLGDWLGFAKLQKQHKGCHFRRNLHCAEVSQNPAGSGERHVQPGNSLALGDLGSQNFRVKCLPFEKLR
jgi:hypothetical protein